MKGKLQLNLNESNKLKFELQIEGSAEDLNGIDPVIRFAINESGNSKGWIFGLSKENIHNDQITIEIPSMKGLVKEGKAYTGKLEVILGNNYFVPTETEIEFNEPIKVEAKVVENKSVLKEAFRINGQMIIEPKKQTNKPVKKQKLVEEKIEQPVKTTVPNEPKVYKQITEDSRKQINEIFLTECRQMQIDDPFEVLLSEGNEVLKKFVKDVFKTSVKSHLMLK